MITESFTAEGPYSDGFPGYVQSEDVSGYDKWTTLSGYNKSDADAGVLQTDIDIRKSRTLAYRLDTNIRKVRMTAAADSYSLTNINVALPLTHASGSFNEFNYEPKQRETFASAKRVEGTGTKYLTMRVRTQPSRLYNGVVTDEQNFVGYGIKNSIYVTATYGYIYLSSHFDAPSTTNYKTAFVYRELDGYHFVVAIRVDTRSAETSSIDLASLSFTHDLDSSVPFTSTCAIQGFDFYTYD